MISSLITFIVEGLIALFFFSNLFIPKKSFKSCSAAVICGYAVLMTVSFLYVIPLNLVAFTCVNFIIIYCAYDTRLILAVFDSIIMTCSMGFSELLFSNFTDNFQLDPTLRDVSIILFFVLSKTTYFIFLLIVSRFSNKDIQHNDKISCADILLLVITSLTMVELFSLYHVLYGSSLSYSSSILIMCCCVCTIVIDLMAVWFMDYMLRKNEESLILHLQLQSEIEKNDFYQALESNYDNQQILIHDINNHLHYIAEHLSDNTSDEVFRYVNKLINSDTLNTTMIYCSDNRLNAILNRYANTCTANNIEYTVDAYNSDTSFISSECLTALFCNLLDNAVEACAGVSDAFINIKITPVSDYRRTFISISNSYAIAPITNTSGEFISTKPDSLHHGYGLKSVRKVVAKYYGNIESFADEDQLTFYNLITLEDK